MKMQISLEMLVAMLLSLTLALLLLQSFGKTHVLIMRTEHLLDRIAGIANTYRSRLS